MELSDLIEQYKTKTELSNEKVARLADISLTQLSTVKSTGFSRGTRLGTIQNIAGVFGMKDWELLRELDNGL